MPARLILPPRNLLAFPSRPAGLDPTHPASQGIVKGRGFSCVAAGATFTNLVDGSLPATFSGGTASVLLGQTAKLTDTQGGTFSSTQIPSKTESALTIGILFFDLTTPTSNVCELIQYQGAFSLRMLTVTPPQAQLTFPNVNNFTANNLTFLSGVPYFFAVSWSAPTFNFVQVNLATGATLSQVVSNAGTPQAPAGTASIALTGGSPAVFGIAAGMVSPTFLSMQQMLQWAAAPWAFWYPPQPVSYVGAASQFVTFTQVGAHIMRPGEMIGY